MNEEFLVIDWSGLSVIGGMSHWLPGTGGGAAEDIASAGYQLFALFESHYSLVGLFT